VVRSRLHLRRKVVGEIAMCGFALSIGGFVPADRGPAATTADEMTTETLEDRFWSQFKEIPVGPGRLSIGGSARFRYEWQNHFNYKSYGDKTRDGFLLGRFRLNFEYKLRERLRAFVELQDARVWGSDFGIDDFQGRSPDENPFDLRQAFVEWTHIGDTPWGFKIGRQSIQYGDNRVWGPGEWGNVGSFLWDAAKVQYDTKALLIEALYARRVRHESDRWNFDDKHFDFDAYGLYATVKNLPTNLDLFFVEKRGRATKPGTRQIERELRHTLGTRLDGRFLGNFDYAGTLAYQFGSWGDDRIRAWGMHTGLGYTFNHAWKPRLGADFAYGSGDSHPGNRTVTTFDGVFGARDVLYYGRMNLFGWSNIEDYQLSLTAHPTDRLETRLDYHYFRLAAAEDSWYISPGSSLRRDATGRSGREVGHEIDFMAKYRLNKRTSLIGIVGMFFPSAFVERTGPHQGALGACLQVMYEF